MNLAVCCRGSVPGTTGQVRVDWALLLLVPVQGFPKALALALAIGFELVSPWAPSLAPVPLEDLRLHVLQVEQIELLLENQALELCLHLPDLFRALRQGLAAVVAQRVVRLLDDRVGLREAVEARAEVHQLRVRLL